MINMKNNKLYVNELIRQLELAGYRCEIIRDGSKYAEIYDGEKNICTLFKNGCYSSNAHPNLNKIADSVKEYLNEFDKAEPLTAEGIQDGYKKILEYNKHVLAARKPKDNRNYEFVTWKYTYDNKGVTLGRYFLDYERAKKNMAERCGLVDKSKMLSETEMKLIHTDLISYVGLDPYITVENERAISRLLDKIESIVPEIERHQLYEDMELINDDGLEL